MKNKLLRPKKVIWGKACSGLIRPCPGFEKKKLGVFKLDLMPFCQFACRYCSSNCGNLMRINTNQIKTWTEEQIGKLWTPRADAEKFYLVYQNPIEDLQRQIFESKKISNSNKVLQFGMLVDNFSPELVSSGVTYEALDILLKKTKFTIRILTKSANVAADNLIELYSRFPGRVIVGLSCGSLDSSLMKQIELFTSTPKMRSSAIRKLQGADVRTYGMFCPVLPGVANRENIEELYSEFNPQRLEAAWCEPYNDRQNWKQFHKSIPDSIIREALYQVMTNKHKWTKYALMLANLHQETLAALGFKGDPYFLFYESGVVLNAIREAQQIRVVLFQSDTSLNSTYGIGETRGAIK